MHPMLTYPFDSSEILKKRKQIKRELIENRPYNIKKKIAVLGGSTTHDIIEILELFLLNYGICPEFYESGLPDILRTQCSAVSCRIFLRI